MIPNNAAMDANFMHHVIKLPPNNAIDSPREPPTMIENRYNIDTIKPKKIVQNAIKPYIF